MKKILLLLLFPVFCYGQVKINIRTGANVPGATGAGLLKFTGTVIDTCKPHIVGIPYYNGSAIVWVPLPAGGGVASVIGTANRITSTGGANPVIDISASYIGQSSITTLGTITTGIWNGTAIANANLANSTISGVSLGSNLLALTPGVGITGSAYNGSGALTWNNDTVTVMASKNWVTNTIAALPGSSPAGLTTEIQYNNAGAFGADASFTKTSAKVSIAGDRTGALGALYINKPDAVNQYIVLAEDPAGPNSAYLTFKSTGGNAIAMGATFNAGAPESYIFTDPSAAVLSSIDVTTGDFLVTNLSGVGSRMVTASATGVLGVAAIPTGTVTSVGTGLGLSGGTITTTGTVVLDTANASVLSRQRAANTYALIGATISGVALGGTLFSLTPGYGLTGSAYNGSAAQGLVADTNSATALVSKTRLANTLGAYVSTMATLGATPNANGATISGSTLTLQPADATFGGALSATTQSIAGAKTLTGVFTASSTSTFTGAATFNAATNSIKLGAGGGLLGFTSGNTSGILLNTTSGVINSYHITNSTSAYAQYELLTPSGTLNTNNFEFTILGSGYASSGIYQANGVVAFARSGQTAGMNIGVEANAPLIFTTGGITTAKERMRIIGTGAIAISGGTTPLTAPTAKLHIAAGSATASTAPLKFTLPGVPLTVREAGAWDTDAEIVMYTPTSLARQVLPGVLFTQTADKTVTNTVTETSLIGTGVGSLSTAMTLPANFFVAGKTLRLKVAGVYSTPIGVPSIIIKVKWGATVIATTTTTSLLASATNAMFEGDVLITCRTTGATGTVMTHGVILYMIGAAGQIATDILNNAGATTTVATNASTLLDITVQWDAATVDRIVKSTVATLEVLN